MVNTHYIVFHAVVFIHLYLHVLMWILERKTGSLCKENKKNRKYNSYSPNNSKEYRNYIGNDNYMVFEEIIRILNT